MVSDELPSAFLGQAQSSSSQRKGYPMAGQWLAPQRAHPQLTPRQLAFRRPRSQHGNSQIQPHKLLDSLDIADLHYRARHEVEALKELFHHPHGQPVTPA